MKILKYQRQGGTPVGIAVQELLDYAGIATDHVAIRTSYYQGIESTAESVQVHGLGYLIRKLNADNKLLIVDDVLDSGKSIEALIAELGARCRRNLPADLRVATCWYKPTKSQTGRVPDFFVHKTDQWLVFPHELQGLTEKRLQKVSLNLQTSFVVSRPLDLLPRSLETHNISL